MFQMILHIVRLEREMEVEQQKRRSYGNTVDAAESTRRSRRLRSSWFFDRFRRKKPLDLPGEQVGSHPDMCRNPRPSLDPAVSRCSTINPGGSN
jgi:hypothetical protein